MNLAAKLNTWWRWLWSHRTKALGVLAVGVGYGQNNMALLGHVLSIRWQGIVLGVFGVLAFLIGLYNTYATQPAKP